MLTNKTTCRVIYGDTDKMGFAYHANYFRWFEAARTELFRNWGLSYRTVEKKGIFLPVSEAYCKFTASVDYDDLLTIETSLDTSVKGAMRFKYSIFNEDQQIVAKGYTKHAFLNSQGKVVRPPEFLKKVIEENS